MYFFKNKFYSAMIHPYYAERNFCRHEERGMSGRGMYPHHNFYQYKDDQFARHIDYRQRPFSAKEEIKRNLGGEFKQEEKKGDRYYRDYQRQREQDDKRMHQNWMHPCERLEYVPRYQRQSSLRRFEFNGPAPHHDMNHLYGRNMPRIKSHDRFIRETTFSRASGPLFDSDFRVKPHYSRAGDRRYYGERMDYKADLRDVYRDRPYQLRRESAHGETTPKREERKQDKDDSGKEEKKEEKREKKEEKRENRDSKNLDEGDRYRYAREFRYNGHRYQGFRPERHLHEGHRFEGFRHEDHRREDYKQEGKRYPDPRNEAHRYEAKRVDRDHKEARHEMNDHRLYGDRFGKDDRYQIPNRKYYSPYELELRGGGEYRHRHNYNYQHAPNNEEYLPYNRYRVERDFERARYGEIRGAHEHHQDHFRAGNRKYFRFEDRRDFDGEHGRIRLGDRYPYQKVNDRRQKEGGEKPQEKEVKDEIKKSPEKAKK